jgi:hypothetical protein
MNIGSNRQLSGENWGRYVDSTEGLVFGNWSSVTAVSASTINVAASNIGGTTTSVSLIAGQTLRGRITSLSVTSGAVVCRSSVWQKGPGGLYTSPSQFSYDDYADWSGFGANGTIIASGSTIASNLGKTVTITSITSTYSMVQGVNWGGCFTSGDWLVYSWGNTVITLSVSTPVKGLGLQMQSGTLGFYAGSATAKDSSNNPIATDLSFGQSTTKADGSAAFVGYQSGAANISKIVLELTDTTKLGKFAFNRLLIKT